MTADILGIATGIVGAVTGIAGLIMGAIAYRQVNSMKALDLRLLLRDREVELRQLLRGLAAHIQHARRSREAVFAASGRTGALTTFKDQCDKDTARASQMALEASRLTDPSKLDHFTLEVRLQSAAQAIGEARQLHFGYAASMEEDAATRRQLMEVNSRVPPRI